MSVLRGSLSRPISLEKALQICERAAKPIEKTEKVPIEFARGRVLAEDIWAEIDVPPFDRSAMDGYAVRSRAIRRASEKNPVIFDIRERIYAGAPARCRISGLECAAIATGGMMPEGADSVVMVEHTKEVDDGKVAILRPARENENVIHAGDDIQEGSKIANTSDLLMPGNIGAISATGVGKVRVYRKPTIIVMPTGDEVIRPGRRLKRGQIYDVNTFTLSTAIESFGGKASILPIVDDTKSSIERSIRDNRSADAIVFSGGSSVGERDLIADVIDDMGEVLFHGVAVKPGKPTILGRVGRTLILGMPGHPTSCLSNAYLFLEPMVRKMGRQPFTPRIRNDAILARDVKLPKGRALILTVRLEEDDAIPVFRESSAITSIADADGFAILTPGREKASKGSRIDVRLF